MNDFLESVAKSAKERYGRRFAEMGVSPRTLGWGSKEDQLTRFQVMTEQIDFAGSTLMDIGCGFADFWKYLAAMERLPDHYIGVDLMEQFIAHNQETYPEAQFICCDFMRQPEQLPEVDYVISNGTMNFKLSDNLSYNRKFLQTAFIKATKGLVVDFLSTIYTPDYPPEDTVYHHSPKDVLDLAFELTPNVRLIHNYAPIPQKEFMIILER